MHARVASRQPAGKVLDAFDFTATSMLFKAHTGALAESDEWIERGENLLASGPPGVSKTHFVPAIGHVIVDCGRRVLFAHTRELVQWLQATRRELKLPAELGCPNRFDLAILDNLSYLRRD